jgi:Holliday junction resolvase
MALNTASKGRRAEHRARALLEAAGFTVCRAAASKGPCDLVGWNSVSVRFISVKTNGYASALEREALQLMLRPPCSTVEIWRFRDRKPPVIEVL